MEDIVCREPVNNIARIVTSEGVAHETTKQCKQNRHSKFPLPLFKIEGHDDTGGIAGGYKKGFLTVLGIYNWGRKKAKKRFFVCKCCCGNYETRSRKALLNPKNKRDRCLECLALSYSKKRADSFSPTAIERPQHEY